eukprot:13803093-Alexandrium_andersonii.AAC.1
MRAMCAMRAMRALQRGLPPPPAARRTPQLALPAAAARLTPRLAPLALLGGPRLALPAALLLNLMHHIVLLPMMNHMCICGRTLAM